MAPTIYLVTRTTTFESQHHEQPDPRYEIIKAFTSLDAANGAARNWLGKARPKREWWGKNGCFGGRVMLSDEIPQSEDNSVSHVMVEVKLVDLQGDVGSLVSADGAGAEIGGDW